MLVSICSPSRHRAEKVLTAQWVEKLRIYVDASEASAYRKHNPGAVIVKCADGVQGNVARVRNYILDKEFGAGVDVVVLLDDDIRHLDKWVPDEDGKDKSEVVGKEEFYRLLGEYSILAEEWGAKLWGINPVRRDRRGYWTTCPFRTHVFVGGPFQVILKTDLRYDERMMLKEDYDYVLQHLNRYRRILRVDRYYHYNLSAENTGGCADYRTSELETRSMEALMRKWGRKIVRLDVGIASRHNPDSGNKTRQIMDWNPRLHIPIKGV